jgi:hypothetical protein
MERRLEEVGWFGGGLVEGYGLLGRNLSRPWVS